MTLRITMLNTCISELVNKILEDYIYDFMTFTKLVLGSFEFFYHIVFFRCMESCVQICIGRLLVSRLFFFVLYVI